MAVQMTAEQFQEFLRMARNPAPANNKNFVHCTARFDGTRSAAKVEEFVTMATIYKNVENLTDGNAIPCSSSVKPASGGMALRIRHIRGTTR
jgi:hypothetical protein